MSERFGSKPESWADPDDEKTSVAPPRRPAAEAGPPGTFMSQTDDELTDVGAQPLIQDEKLGWETSPANRKIEPPGSGGATRLSTELAPIERSRTWLVVAVVVALLAGAAVAAIRCEWLTL